MGQVSLNLDKLNAAIRESFADVVAAVDVEVDRVIQDENEFSDRGFVDQDIVDTTRLLRSKVVDAKADRASWEWDPKHPGSGYPYAMAVYSGIGEGGRIVVGRPWAERAIDNVGVAQAIADGLQKRGIQSRAIAGRRLT